VGFYQGAAYPETYAQAIVPGASGLDLTTVTAGRFKVFRPDGTIVTWTAVLSNQTVSTLTLTHAFGVNSTDIDVAGTYVIYAELDLPASGKATATRVEKKVLSKFGVER